ncbi:MAG: MAPEG family protein [Myxococcales bacterium]|nr:MAPEG family protein [Myxococcales bacterium]
MITSLYTGFAAFLLCFLSLRVVSLRRRKRVSVGHQGDAEIERAMRTQANFTEYTPMVLILLFLIESTEGDPRIVHGLGSLFIFARLLHFVGFNRPGKPSLARVLGMVGTFATLIIGGILAVSKAVSNSF